MTPEKNLTGYPSIDKPWQKYYSTEALSAVMPECSIYEYLQVRNQDNLNSAAISFYGTKITYRELFQRIDLTAEKLKGLGISCGDMVVLMMLNIPETVILLYALNKIGAISDWIYFTKDTKEIIRKICDTQSKWFISLAVQDIDYHDIAAYVQKIIMIPINQSMPWYMKTLMSFKRKNKRYSSSHIMTWNELHKIKGIKQEKPMYDKGAPAVIVHTGGTTGEPKGVMLSDDNLNSVGFQTMCNDVGLSRGDKLLHLIPPFVAFGISLGTHLSLTNGLSIIMDVNPDFGKAGKFLRKYHPNAIPAGPAFVEGILSDKKIDRKAFKEIKILLVGGEMLTLAREQYANDYLQKKGSSASIQNGYGMTETAAFGTLNMNKGRTKVGSLGIPNSHTIISIFSPETGNECKYGEEGEICVSSPTLMLGYYNNPNATAEVIKEHDGRRWMHSGDIGYMDEDGFVFFTGRMKRLYIVKNPDDMTMYKVFPTVLENVIEELDGIASSCVVCAADLDWVNKIIAFVQLEKGTDSQNEIKEKIVSHCKISLPQYYQPAEIHFIDKIPLTTINKKDYKKLEKLLSDMESNKD